MVLSFAFSNSISLLIQLHNSQIRKIGALDDSEAGSEAGLEDQTLKVHSAMLAWTRSSLSIIVSLVAKKHTPLKDSIRLQVGANLELDDASKRSSKNPSVVGGRLVYSNLVQGTKGRYTALTAICLLGKDVQPPGGSVIQEETARLKI